MLAVDQSREEAKARSVLRAFQAKLVTTPFVCIGTCGKIRQVYPPKNFLSPISLKVREIIVLVNLF